MSEGRPDWARAVAGAEARKSRKLPARDGAHNHAGGEPEGAHHHQDMHAELQDHHVRLQAVEAHLQGLNAGTGST